MDVVAVDAQREHGGQCHHAAHRRHVVQVRLGVLDVAARGGEWNKNKRQKSQRYKMIKLTSLSGAPPKTSAKHLVWKNSVFRWEAVGVNTVNLVKNLLYLIIFTLITVEPRLADIYTGSIGVL